jgi:hypothetical protein
MLCSNIVQVHKLSCYILVKAQDTIMFSQLIQGSENSERPELICSSLQAESEVEHMLATIVI